LHFNFLNVPELIVGENSSHVQMMSNIMAYDDGQVKRVQSVF